MLASKITGTGQRKRGGEWLGCLTYDDRRLFIVITFHMSIPVVSCVLQPYSGKDDQKYSIQILQLCHSHARRKKR